MLFFCLMAKFSCGKKRNDCAPVRLYTIRPSFPLILDTYSCTHIHTHPHPSSAYPSHSFTLHPLTHSLTLHTHSHTRPPHSLTHSSFTLHSLTHPLTLHTHSSCTLTHSLTHSLTLHAVLHRLSWIDLSAGPFEWGPVMGGRGVSE